MNHQTLGRARRIDRSLLKRGKKKEQYQPSDICIYDQKEDTQTMQKNPGAAGPALGLVLPSGRPLVLVLDPPEPDGGPFLDLLHAVRRRGLGLHEALADLLLVPVGPGGSAEPLGPVSRVGIRPRGVVPLVGPRRGFVVRLHVFAGSDLSIAEEE